jgi:hypothetical protein
MPQFTYADRMMIQAEQSLWNVTEILKQEANTDHGFTKQIRELMKQASQLAGEIRDYNDQFETEE